MTTMASIAAERKARRGTSNGQAPPADSDIAGALDLGTDSDYICRVLADKGIQTLAELKHWLASHPNGPRSALLYSGMTAKAVGRLLEAIGPLEPLPVAFRAEHAESAEQNGGSASSASAL